MTSSATIPTTKDTDSTAGAFTPGPWEYHPTTSHHGPYVTATAGDVADLYYVKTSPFTHRPDIITHQPDCAEANARLISAAPDLYEALIRTVGALIEHAPHEQETIQRAQFAIAKAEGRS